MKKFVALSFAFGALALSACTDVPPCPSSDLDCNVGAYSEERTFRDATGATSNINPAAGEPAPAPVATPKEPVFEPVVEPVAEPAPAPAPVDTQVMQKADQTPSIKSVK